MKLMRYNQFILEGVDKWKRSWVKDDSSRELGSEYPPHEMLEYVTSFHDQDSYDESDFYERTHQYEKFVLKMISLSELDLEEFQLEDWKVDEYIEDYKNENGEYPAIVVGEGLNHGYKYGIIDGLHRANALHRLGKTEIKAYVGTGSPDYMNESMDRSTGREFDYEDEYVEGRLSEDGDTIKILDWNSKNIEKGGTIKSLKKLRKKYKNIIAVDTGYEGEPSHNYWEHMMDHGFIDGHWDDAGGYNGYNFESFNLSDEELENLLDDQEGFNSREDAKEYLDDMVEYYKNLDDTITLYRILFIDEDSELDEDNMGDHWTPESHLPSDPNWINRIKEVNDASSDDQLYIIEATFKTSDIKWDWTIHTNLAFPNEEEIMIDGAKPIEYNVYKSIEEFKNR